MNEIQIIVVTGPTATGKTALAVRLARRFDGEIVSVDSRQVYRGMDIGSGKDIEEYGDTPYHLIDIADPAKETYNLGRFCRDAFAAIGDIAARGKLPVLCGGTALYLDALLQSYTLPGGKLPEREAGAPRQRQDLTLPPSFTPPFALKPLILGVLYPRAVVRERIEKRLDTRLQHGLIEEVQRLHESGILYEKLEFFGLEYREVSLYLQNFCTQEEMRTSLLNRIRQFAKRQDIFFRKIEREGHDIHWIAGGKEPDPFALCEKFLKGEAIPAPEFRLCEHQNPPRPQREKR